jgi:VIT1/CCC1 family predicted Fe2+/Mn2+ transporter
MNYLKKFHADNWHAAENRAARRVVYAFDAGLLTTIAFLAGVTASNLNCKTIMLSGLASITSCTLTVFFLAYISTKSWVDFFEGQIERKERELSEAPQKAKDEARELLSDMGLERGDAEAIAGRITADKKRWLDFMISPFLRGIRPDLNGKRLDYPFWIRKDYPFWIKEALGIDEDTFDNPAKTGFLAAMFYLSGAFVLMMPFIIFDNPMAALKIAGGLALLFLFIAGILKAVLTKQKWVFSALEMILVGVVSCAIGFAFGSFAAKLFAKIIG